MPPDNPGSLSAHALLQAWSLVLFLCATATLLALPLKTEAVSNQGLVGYWKFDDGTGTKATDFSGNGNHGTLSTAGSLLPTWTSGKRGKALNFDGDEAYVRVPHNSSLNPTSGITVAAWIRADAWSGGPRILQKGNSNNQYRLSVESGVFRWYLTGVTELDATVPSTGVWHHVVGAYNGSANVVYVDGVAIAQEGASGAVPTTADDLYIGGVTACIQPDDCFDGIIDEVRIYNRALSASEVAEHYRAGASLLKPPNNLGLVGYWSFNEGTGTKATDFSGNGNTGTFVGAPTWVTGKRSTALHFDSGVGNQYVTTRDIDAVDGASQMTISFWTKGDSFDSNQTFISKFAAGSVHWVLQVSGGCGGSDDMEFIATGQGDYGCTTSNVLVPGIWQHWVVVFDGTQAGDATRAKMYLNGTQKTLTFGGNSIPAALVSNSQAVTIGQTADGAAPSPSFIMDEVRIYNRALSATEVASLYGGGSNPGSSGAVQIGSPTKTLQNGTTLANGLVGHWTFDGPDVTTVVADRSGQGNNGYFIGGATSSAKISAKLGQGLSFDGVNDHVFISNISSVTTNYSVAFWMYFGQLLPGGTQYGLFTIGGGCSYVLNENEKLGNWNNGSAGSEETGFGTALTPGAWRHVTFVNNSGTLTPYVDGAPFGTPISSTPQCFGGAVEIGGWVANSNFLNGKLDDVRIYNRALSPTEVKQLYQLGTVQIAQ